MSVGAPAPNANYQANAQQTYTQPTYPQQTYPQSPPPQPTYSQPTFNQPAYGMPQGNVAAAPKPASKFKLTDPKVLIIGGGVIILLVIVLILTLGGSGGKGNLVGTWVSSEGYEMIFEKDGTMKIGAYGFYVSGKYSVKGNKLTIDFYGEVNSTNFKISGNKLTLLDDDGTTETFTRKK